MNRFMLAAFALAASCIAWQWGQPSETDAARAVAQDLRDAQADARKSAHIERAEAAMQREERTRIPVVVAGVRG